MQQATQTTHRTTRRGPHRERASRPAVNDLHSRLNHCTPALQRRPETLAELRGALRLAARHGLGISIAGGRHAMGGQQFLQDGLLLDMRGMNRILDFDPEQGLVTVEAGATWPELMRRYLALQAGSPLQWGFL